ncbi:MAG: hypothetical protein Nk1A_9270 [Endomicrobiia bacterium]|nr:MAG: hypothetical protein Nk1A_9270 [Endomicrobiia bacterium]
MGGQVPAGPPEGAAPEGAAPEGAPVQEPPQGGGGGDPLAEIAQVAAQALQNQDCQAAMAVCEAFLQLVQQVGGGGCSRRTSC